jgi:hypothetical protein
MLLYFPGNSGVDLEGYTFMKGYLPNRKELLEYTFYCGAPQPYDYGSLNDSGWVALPKGTEEGLAEHLQLALQGLPAQPPPVRPVPPSPASPPT